RVGIRCGFGTESERQHDNCKGHVRASAVTVGPRYCANFQPDRTRSVAAVRGVGYHRGMATPDAKIPVLGIGGDGPAGLTGRSRDLLAAADLVLGSDAALGLLPDLRAE